MESTATAETPTTPDPVFNREYAARGRGRPSNLEKLDTAGRMLYAETSMALRAAAEERRRVEMEYTFDRATKSDKLDAEEGVFNAITAFRKAKGSWEQIAKAMGVTYQSAYVWYKRRLVAQ